MAARLLYTGLRVRKVQEFPKPPEEDQITGWKEVRASLLVAGWEQEFLVLTPLGWSQHPSKGEGKLLFELLAGFGIQEPYPGQVRPHPSAQAFLGPKGFLARLRFVGWLVPLEVRDAKGTPLVLHSPQGPRPWGTEE
ncbi:MAG: hypothetical protein ABDH20_03375 [Thermus sp.]